MDLNSLNLFVKVVEQGSFSAASKSTNVPVSTVSRRISELEKDLNVRLLERSTRQLRVTDSGKLLYEFAQKGVAEFDAGILALQSRENEISGKLRLSMPPHFEPWWDLLRDFQGLYKNIELDLFVTERKVDFIEDAVDVALRVGNVDTLSSVARKLHQYKHILVASPQFIAQFGQPNSPQDLVNYPCAAWYKKHNTHTWTLGEVKTKLSTCIRANDYLHMRHIALHHEAITELPPFLAKEYLLSGELVEVLPNFPFSYCDVSLVYPSRKHTSRISKVYIDYCIKNAADYL